MSTRLASRTILAAAAALALASVGETAGPAGAQGGPEPAPTSTPNEPGIVLYKSPTDTPDPFLLDADGRYHLFVSTAIGSHLGIPEVTGKPGDWSKPHDALASVPSWALPVSQGGKDWAPFVYRFGSTYVLYYAPTVRKTGVVQHCIATATSKSPDGPYVSTQGRFVCNLAAGGDIDAQVFRDTSGPNGPSHPYYLIWKSDEDSEPGLGPTNIWAAGLSNDGMQLTSSPIRIYAPDQAWQANLIEAPQMVLDPDNHVWLYYSAGGYFSDASYSIGYASCLSPLGPCTDTTNQPLLSSNEQGSGPGEETAYTGADGSNWLLYNPWHTAIPYEPVRPVEAVRIGFDGGSTYLAQAGTFPAP